MNGIWWNENPLREELGNWFSIFVRNTFSIFAQRKSDGEYECIQTRAGTGSGIWVRANYDRASLVPLSIKAVREENIQWVLYPKIFLRKYFQISLKKYVRISLKKYFQVFLKKYFQVSLKEILWNYGRVCLMPLSIKAASWRKISIIVSTFGKLLFVKKLMISIFCCLKRHIYRYFDSLEFGGMPIPLFGNAQKKTLF